MQTIPAPPASQHLPAEQQFDSAYLWSIALIAAMGGLLFGYDWVVIGGAKPFFEPFFRLTTDSSRGWANSCALTGCLVGSLVSGALSDRFGRKRLLIASALLFAVSSVLTGWAQTIAMFVTWRIAGGVAIGMASNLSPMYIAEVAPPRMRGRLVSVNQLTIVIGILMAQVVNLLIAHHVPDNASAELIRQSWNGQFGWRWMFTAVAVPSLLFFLGTLFVPESPRWLVKNGKAQEAMKVLVRLADESYARSAIADIELTLASEQGETVDFGKLLQPEMARILMIGVVLAVLQQWSGINVIFNYAEEIFRNAGYGISSIMFNIVITGVVMLAFTLIAVQTVDRFGRRPLMLWGCGGIALFHVLIGAAYHLHLKGLIVVLPVLGSIACYSFSLAPVTWVLISEIFPNAIRGAAVSVAVSALWIACFVLTYTFPLLNATLGAANTFFVYAFICAAGAVFIWWSVPETKGKSLEQIERELVR